MCSLTRRNEEDMSRFVSARGAYAGRVIEGDVLRQARERAGLSQAALGAMLGVTGRTIRAWESDVVKPYAERRVAELDVLWAEQEPAVLAELSDAALLAEISALVGEMGLRLDRLRQMQHKGHDLSTDAETSGNDPVTTRDVSKVAPAQEGSAAPPTRKAARGWGTDQEHNTMK